MKNILIIGCAIWFGLVVLLTVTACKDDGTPLTPFQCRVVGVAVEDEDTVTGTIVEEIFYQSDRESRAACFKPFSTDNLGCVIALNKGEYRVVWSTHRNVRLHEQCHAYYEEWKHM
jgi:hypothetical protein